MLDTSVRLLRLLSLRQVRRDWSGADLASRLGVTTRTVRNDIERLRILGYEVHSSTGIEETSLRALSKLQQILPARLRHRLDALRQATVSAAGGGPTVDAEMLTTIADACRDHEQLCFDYPGAHRAAVHAARAARGHRAAIRCVTSSVISRASTSRSRSWTRQNSGPCCASSPTATPQPLATRPGRRSGT